MPRFLAGMTSRIATSSTVTNRLSVAAPRLRKSGEAEMTSILIETETKSRPMSAPAAPPMTTANVSHPGKATPGVGNLVGASI